MSFDYSQLHSNSDLFSFNKEIEEGHTHEIDKAALGEAVIKAMGEETYNEITSGRNHPVEDHQYLYLKVAEDYIKSFKTTGKTQEVAGKALSWEEIKKSREDFPLRNSVFQMELKFFQKEKGLDQLKPEHVNTETTKGVYKLENKEKEPVFYFKTGDSAKMEIIMWDVGIAMHYEDVLTVTKTTSIQLKELKSPELTDGTGGTGALDAKNSPKTMLKGELQEAQKGMLLEDYFKKTNKTGKVPFEISRENLIKGTLASLVLGMFDAHSKNVIVSEDSLNFIDNTCSLAHSSQYIIGINGNILLPYRSSLLGLEGSYMPLSLEERQQIRDRICEDLNHLKYLAKEPNWQSKANGLPPHWLNPQDALAAMQDRLTRMEKAIEDPRVETLRDLVFETIPQFKFMAALTCATKLFEKFQPYINKPEAMLSIQMILLEGTGTNPLASMLYQCAMKGLNPAELKLWCETLPFENVISKIYEESSIAASDTDKSRLLKCQKAGIKIMEDAISQAKFDMKDLSPKAIKEAIDIWKKFKAGHKQSFEETKAKSKKLEEVKTDFKQPVKPVKTETKQSLEQASEINLNQFKSTLKQTSLRIIKSWQEVEIDPRPLGRSIIIDDSKKPPECFFIAKDGTGKGIRVKAKLDYTSSPGKVDITSLELTKNGQVHSINHSASLSIQDGKTFEEHVKSLMASVKELEKKY